MNSENYFPTLPDPPPAPAVGPGSTAQGYGPPTGTVVPVGVGQIYVDLGDPGGIWAATGPTSNDWRQYVG